MSLQDKYKELKNKIYQLRKDKRYAEADILKCELKKLIKKTKIFKK